MTQDIIERIMDLKRKRNAVILSHNYQIPEVQDIADFVGDSLGLSQEAAKTNADVIVFCGVHFMAETASILCPDKIVLLPDINAGCRMANMINAAKLRNFKAIHPDAVVVCYVNTTAEVKAESYVCCTSANAVKVVNSLDSQKIIFVPDKYLGNYVLGKSDKKFILWNGFCPSHIMIRPDHIANQREKFPDAEVVVHPECTPDVVAIADKVFSTTGMCRYAKETSAKRMIIGTEIGILHRLRKENPDKEFIPATEVAICPNMKLNTLEKVLWALEEMKYQVKVPQDIRIKARSAVQRMLEIGRQD
jgi:quinolinate synthase